MPGPIHRLLSDDHVRLDNLLQQACAQPDRIDPVPYAEFRKGLLRHIGMEEKILLPAAQRVRGEPLPIAAHLRLEHGAIAALMVPSPTPVLVAVLHAILARHNLIEENPGGLYDTCDECSATTPTCWRACRPRPRCR